MKFIRVDEKGTWMGTEHVSSMGEPDDIWEFDGMEVAGGHEEGGISCYKLDNGYGIEEIRSHWLGSLWASEKRSDWEDKQITIFEGEHLGEGSDWEEIATCARTLAELDAADFMEKVFELYDKMDFEEEITEEEYEEALAEMVKGY